MAVIFVSAISYSLFVSHLRGNLDDALQREAQAYSAAMLAATEQAPGNLAEASREYVDSRLPDPDAVYDAGLFVWLAEENVSYSSPSWPLGDTAASESDLQRGSKPYRDIEDLSIDGQEYRIANIPIESDSGELRAVFQVAISTAPVEEAAGGLPRALIIAGIILVTATALASKLVAAAALRPLRSAARTAGKITYSSLSERVPYDGPPDDVGLMVDSLNRMLDRLEASFAEQRRFIADASHELRTPLTIARGHLDVMRSQGGLDEDQEGTLDIVTEELQRTSNLVSDLLSLARLEAGGPPPFQTLDLGQVVEEAVARGQGLGQRRFLFEHGGSLPVFGNQDLLLQALLNLLSNAVGHTEEDGTISVVCSSSGDMARVVVTDDGPGIREEELERVFDRFFRAQGQPRPGGGGGSGLGLAIARRLVELHGGRIWAENANGSGAVFVVTLPLLSPAG